MKFKQNSFKTVNYFETIFKLFSVSFRCADTLRMIAE